MKKILATILKMLRKKKNSDWRLPTIKELLTLVDYNKYYNSDGFFLSSDIISHNRNGVWVVDLCYGYIHFFENSRDYEYNVLLVKGSLKTGLEWVNIGKKSFNRLDFINI